MAYRAQYARVAAILAINEALTLEYGALAKIATTYGVPLLTPASLDPEAHREAIDAWQAAQDAEAGTGRPGRQRHAQPGRRDRQAPPAGTLIPSAPPNCPATPRNARL